LNRTDSDSLVPFVAASVSPHLPADIGFINFDNASQKLAVNLSHGRTYAVTEIPSRFIGNAKCPLHLKRTHALFRFRHKVDRQKPLRERKVRVVKDRPACYRKLITTSVAVVLVALRDCRNAFRLAAWTHNAFRPSQRGKLCAALFIASELRDQLRKVHVCFEGLGRFIHCYA
jgi:hypothetical protein